jgi:hypothetical protein
MGGRNENTLCCSALFWKKQTWGLNFSKNDPKKYTWNFIDSKLGTFTTNGVLEGIANIKPPTRLFLMPYSSFYVMLMHVKDSRHLERRVRYQIWN